MTTLELALTKVIVQAEKDLAIGKTYKAHELLLTTINHLSATGNTPPTNGETA